MKFYIKEWSDRTVALMIGHGQVLAYFASVADALAAIRSWYQFNGQDPQAVVIIDDGKTVAAEHVETAYSFGF